MTSVSTSLIEKQSSRTRREEYIVGPNEWVEAIPVVEDSARGRLLDTNVKCLLALGGVPIIVGIAIGIWPVALVGLGPWLLAWLDISQRRHERKRQGM